MFLADLDAFLRPNLEIGTYIAFFGMLAIFGGLEMALARREAPDRRRRWPANIALTVINIVVLGALPISALAVADYAAAHGLGVFNILGLPALAVLVIGFLARTLLSYLVHVAMHKVPILWQVHRVHHTDRTMDVTTTVRFHPLEFVISVPIVLGATLALGLSPLALILYELVDAAMAVFTHADVRLPRRLDRGLRWLLVTPAMHRIHHSSHQPETDSNYGATLSIWDRVFGTHRPVATEAAPLGLAESQDARTNSLWWLLRLPFASRRIAPAAG